MGDAPSFARRRRARVAVLGDTHGVLDERVAAAARECDAVVHTGDVGARAVLDALGAAGAPVLAVYGNNDVPAKWPRGEGAVLRALPQQVTLALPGGALVVEHGHEAGAAKTRHARLRARHGDARAVAVGHSHHARIDDDEEPWVLNPGAAGRARTYGGPSWIELVATRAGWAATLHRYEPAGKGRGRAR
jgi:putative phosphoesterase